MIVKVRDVGGDRVSWDMTLLDSTDPDSLCEHVRRSVDARRALLSRDVDVYYYPEKNHGEIVVGGFRVVGTFTAEPASTRAA